MMTLRVGSLFSGLGGFDLGFQWAGMKTVWVCEHDPFCQFVLAERFPDAKRYSDVRALRDPEEIDVLCGGFPCQDISIAGNSYNGEGIDGKKSSIWSEFARLIRTLRPEYVVIENSPLLARRGLDRVLCDLASCGYDAEWSRLSAAAFGAPHIRERIIIVAYPSRNRREGGYDGSQICLSQARWKRWRDGFDGSTWWDSTHQPPRVDNGVPVGMDATWRARFRTLGNALIPQIAYFVGEGIVEDHANRSQG